VKAHALPLVGVVGGLAVIGFVWWWMRRRRTGKLLEE